MHELLAQYAANKNRIAERREKLKNENISDSIRFCEEQVINAKEIDIMYPLLDAVNDKVAMSQSNHNFYNIKDSEAVELQTTETTIRLKWNTHTRWSGTPADHWGEWMTFDEFTARFLS